MPSSNGATKLQQTEFTTGIFQLGMFSAVFAMIGNLLKGTARALDMTDFKILMWGAGLFDLLRAIYKTIHLFITKNKNLEKVINFCVEWYKAGLIVTAVTPRIVESMIYHGLIGKAALGAVAGVAAATPFLFLVAMAGWTLFELGAVAWHGYQYYRYAYSKDYENHQDHPEVRHLVQSYKANLALHSTKLTMALGLTVAILLVFVLHVAVPYVSAITAIALLAYAAYGLYSWYQLRQAAKAEENAALTLNIQQKPEELKEEQDLKEEQKASLSNQTIEPLPKTLQIEMESDYFYVKKYEQFTNEKENQKYLLKEIQRLKDKLRDDESDELNSWNFQSISGALQSAKRNAKAEYLAGLEIKIQHEKQYETEFKSGRKASQMVGEELGLEPNICGKPLKQLAFSSFWKEVGDVENLAKAVDQYFERKYSNTPTA